MTITPQELVSKRKSAKNKRALLKMSLMRQIYKKETKVTHTIEFDPKDNLIIYYAHGKMNIHELIDMVKDAITFAQKMDCSNLLAVLNEADLNEITILDYYTLPRAIAKIMNDHGLPENHFKRALVGSQEQELLHFYETVTLNCGFHTKLFYDFEQAKTWLRSDKVE